MDAFLVGDDSVESPNGISSEWLTVSPYVERPHLLNLQSIAVPQQLLARALQVLRPTCENYATASYRDCFNWGEVVQNLKDLLSVDGHVWNKRSFYLVAFRSQVKAETDRSYLGALDSSAHAEAMKSGGLLKYWFGTPDNDRRNLATCVWDTREDAARAGGGQAHREAAKKTEKLYSEWRMERLRLDIGDDADQWSIQAWE
ncbi:MAG: hypothetical protein Q9191_007722 [Dirinaria sp. TL-2023a]